MPHTILALHYWAGSGREFDSLRPLLPAGIRLLAPDLPGFGQELIPAGFDFSMRAYADWVADYIARENLSDFTLLGHSMGGKIALSLAVRQPTALRQLVLLSPSPPAGEPMSDKDRAAALAAYGNLAEARKTCRKITQRPLPAAAREVVIADNLRCSQAAWDTWLISGSQEDISAEVAGLAVPCQLLVGAHDKAIKPATQCTYTLPYLPAGTACQVVPEAGHLLPLETPEFIAALMLE